MSNPMPNAMPKDKSLAKHKFLIVVFMGALLALALAFSMDVAHAVPPDYNPRPDNYDYINVDVPLYSDPICGFTITVKGPRPYHFYPFGVNPIGTQNPWGTPKVEETPIGSSVWTLTYGGIDGPCYKRADFPKSMFHYGFAVDAPPGTVKGTVNCVFSFKGLYEKCKKTATGHSWKWMQGVGVLEVFNFHDQVVQIENLRWNVLDERVSINDLFPTLTEHGAPLWLKDNIIPAAQGDQPGVLSIDLPAELQGQHGHLVMSYDVHDAANPEQFSTVTLATPLQ